MSVHETTAEIGELARHLRGRVIMPGDQDWDTARRPWNRRVDQRPAAVVEPAGPDDMAATVAFAGRYGLRVTAQPSGHGAGADLADTVLLRTSRLREIALDPERGRALVGAGVRFGDLMTAASPYGLSASAGSVPSLGVVGFAMFGGVGILGRTLGFMADHVAAAEVVTADGSRIRCDAADHPDLFWALRGGGGGSALVTRLELRLARLPEIFGGQLVWPREAAPEVLGVWRSLTQLLPPQMTSSLAMVQLPTLPEVPEPMRGQTVTVVTACYAGPAEDGENLLRPLKRAAEPLWGTCRSLAPADLPTLAGVPWAPRPVSVRSELLSDLPDAAAGAFLRHAPEPGSVQLAGEIRHLGGGYAEKRHDGGSGAIGRTDAQYLVEFVGHAETAEAETAIRGWQGSATSALAPWITGAVLPSFADPSSAADSGRVFPPGVRRRLASVKRRYDPGNTLLASFPC